MSSDGFSLRGLLFLVVGVPATLLFSLISLVGGLLRAPAGLHDWVHRRWSRFLLAAAGVEVRVSGEENLEPGGAQVLACNHQSMFDILALMAFVPASVRFVAKAEIASVPVFAGAMRSSGHVFIDRTNPRHAISQMRSFGERMRRDGGHEGQDVEHRLVVAGQHLRSVGLQVLLSRDPHLDAGGRQEGPAPPPLDPVVEPPRGAYQSADQHGEGGEKRPRHRDDEEEESAETEADGAHRRK